MYICNLEKMKKHIGGDLENFKEEVKEADKRQKLDKETQCICNLEMSFTEEILKLIDKYISKTKEL
jgi:hypothetical protein